MTEKVLFELHADGVGLLTFNRPQTHNALDWEAMQAFSDQIAALHQLPALRVLVLAGAGEAAFCSGGDLHELSQYPTADDALRMITLMGDALLRMELLPVPVIAAINGFALGGGSEIAVACDLRIADEETRMGFVQIRIGVTPGWGAGQRLLRLVGYTRAFDLLARGAVIHAPELLTLGLVNRVVEAGTARQHAINLAQHLATQPVGVVRGIKHLLQTGLHHSYVESLAIERSLFPPLWESPEHAEAVAQFLQRQTAK